eukprot:3928947-Prymnesium_polylepis.2
MASRYSLVAHTDVQVPATSSNVTPSWHEVHADGPLPLHVRQEESHDAHVLTHCNAGAVVKVGRAGCGAAEAVGTSRAGAIVAGGMARLADGRPTPVDCDKGSVGRTRDHARCAIQEGRRSAAGDAVGCGGSRACRTS